MPPYIPGNHTEQVRPLTPGCSIGHWFGLGPGTLSFFGLWHGWVVGVSLRHVFYPRGTESSGEARIIQPAQGDGPRDNNHVVMYRWGSQVPGVLPSEYAWAGLAYAMNVVTERSELRRGFSLVLPGIGAITGRMPAYVGQEVVGLGRTSGVITGRITALDREVPTGGGTEPLVWFRGLGAINTIVQPGDSGMPLLDAATRRLVGVVQAVGPESYFSHERYIPEDIQVLGAS